MRYLVFSGGKYYPAGGMKDLVWYSNDYSEVKMIFNKLVSISSDYSEIDPDFRKQIEKKVFPIIPHDDEIAWLHILDSDNMKTIKEYSSYD